MQTTVAVVGLGYVGLPVLVAFGRRFPGAIGFDINPERIDALVQGHDATCEVTSEELVESGAQFTTDPKRLAEANFIIVTVPTPIDDAKQPDLSPLLAASRTIALHMAPGSTIVYESTVYPGVTEDVCGPLLAEVSGLAAHRDFKLGYSPERINPGDHEHRFSRIAKVVSGEDESTLARVAETYGAVVEAPIHRAPSIRVAEAAKVIENTQRDLNIALMNELSIIFDRVGLRTADVLGAARTKWNFLPFEPGLVGGHCIGVDPYYLTAMAEGTGYSPRVILAGRHINEGMGRHVAHTMAKLLCRSGRAPQHCRVGILGLTFKPDVPDLRNSKVVDIIKELRAFSVEPLVHDPLASPATAREVSDVALKPLEELTDLDGLIVAVPHRAFLEDQERIVSLVRDGGVFVDVKSAFQPGKLPENLTYWSL
jgi:UDP-N-acetyl-D-galactosamine dehydrogenase